MESEKERKQEYLRKEILEASYDAEDFVEFMHSTDTGDDIDKITIKQLMDIVKTYKKKRQSDSTTVTKTSKQLGFDSETLIKSNQDKQPSGGKQVVYEKYGVTERDFSKTFKCLKLKTDKVFQKEIKIEVSDPVRKTSGGLFGIGSTSYILFKIQTLEMGWNVRRRYSDFQWLRGIVCKFFPTHIIPPIPKKKASKRTTRDLVKRMHILTFFLNDLAARPEMFASKFVQGFMSMTEEQQFQTLRREGNHAQAFETITSLETITGEVTVGICSQQKLFCEQLETFLGGAEVLYKTVNKSARQLQANFQDQTNTLYTMSNQFAELYGCLKTFNTKVPQAAQTGLNETYITLNNMMIEWGNIVKNQHAFIQKSFLPFFRYIRNQTYSFKELYAKVNLIEADYFKARASLDKKKQRIFQMNDLNKWEVPSSQLPSVPASAIKNKTQAMQIMLPKESFQLDKLRMNYAFYISQYKQHASQLLEHGATRFNDNFKEFAINIKVNTQQLAGLWTEVATNFADPKQTLELMNVKKSQKEIQSIDD